MQINSNKIEDVIEAALETDAAGFWISDMMGESTIYYTGALEFVIAHKSNPNISSSVICCEGNIEKFCRNHISTYLADAKNIKINPIYQNLKGEYF